MAPNDQQQPDFLTWLHEERVKMEAERLRKGVTLKQWQEEELRLIEQRGVRVIRRPSASLSR